MATVLDFEKPIIDIQNKIEELRQLSESSGLDLEDQIESFERQAEDKKKELYSTLKPSQKLQISRHSERPKFLDYVHLMCEDFIELHGDREGMDDRAIIGGIAKFNGKPVMIIGIQKGKSTKENLEYNFGMPQPQGYRKALRLFKHADKFKMPIITIIDTPGAYPGIKAEETGQGAAIAMNLREMSKLSVPAISPEGCASILWRDASKFADAAEALRITSKDLLELGVIDEEIPEPIGGAHTDYETTAKAMKTAIEGALEKLSKMSAEELRVQRYDKFRKMGQFIEM